MKFVILGLVVGFLAYNVVSYRNAYGTVAERLAAGWRRTLTLFTGATALLASILTAGMDGLAQITGDPLFGQWAEAIKAVIPPTWHPYIPIVGIGATMLARLRTAKA